jgi:hypothetical protein
MIWKWLGDGLEMVWQWSRGAGDGPRVAQRWSMVTQRWSMSGLMVIQSGSTVAQR